MTYDDELPNHAFTELERAAGVPHLYRTRAPRLSNNETEEIQPNVTRDELVARLVKSVYDGGVDVKVQTKGPMPEFGDYYLHSFDDHRDTPVPHLYLEIDRDCIAPITFLTDAMRASGVPLLSDTDGWLAWDTAEQRLKSCSSSIEFLWEKATVANPKRSSDARELRLMKWLRRAVLSTDHGKKPLLIQNDFLSNAMQRRPVKFEAPNRIPGNAFEQYALVFYNSSGEPASIPLGQVAALKCPIFTRTGAYICSNGDLLPILNNATLSTGSFLIAVNHKLGELHWFVAREQGTIFHSGIERIETPKNASLQNYIPWDEEDVLRSVSNFIEQVPALGTVYLTLGEHPLEAELVTTPELYFHAMKTLQKFSQPT